MACHICGRDQVLHGSELLTRSESGCHDGVWMDDDVYHEGWQRDVIYQPCPHNPAACPACHGTGEAPDEDECPVCEGLGWADNNPQWPTEADQVEA